MSIIANTVEIIRALTEDSVVEEQKCFSAALKHVYNCTLITVHYNYSLRINYSHIDCLCALCTDKPNVCMITQQESGIY